MTSMRRVFITGAGIVSPAGLGAEPFLVALHERVPLGGIEEIPALRGRAARVRVARIPPFDREAHLSPRAQRRMAEVSQIWTIACLMARNDAGLAGHNAAAHPPERRGTYLGTGFGCIDATWDYLLPMMREGPGTASPFLFSESVANAPAGHSAIEMDTRGAAITFTCGDASAAVAVSRAAEAIRQERVEVAWAGGIDLMVPPLLRVLASLGVPFTGEGAVCFVLEEAEAARRRGARVLAEVAGSALVSDPRATATLWSRDPAVYGKGMRRALGMHSDDEGRAKTEEHRGDESRTTANDAVPPLAEVHLHAASDALARQAEESAASLTCPDVPVTRAADVMGMFGASGGFGLAAAVLACAGASPSRRQGSRLVSSAAWGGALCCLSLSPPVSAPRDRR